MRFDIFLPPLILVLMGQPVDSMRHCKKTGLLPFHTHPVDYWSISVMYEQDVPFIRPGNFLNSLTYSNGDVGRCINFGRDSAITDYRINFLKRPRHELYVVAGYTDNRCTNLPVNQPASMYQTQFGAANANGPITWTVNPVANAAYDYAAHAQDVNPRPQYRSVKLFRYIVGEDDFDLVDDDELDPGNEGGDDDEDDDENGDNENDTHRKTHVRPSGDDEDDDFEEVKKLQQTEAINPPNGQDKGSQPVNVAECDEIDEEGEEKQRVQILHDLVGNNDEKLLGN